MTEFNGRTMLPGKLVLGIVSLSVTSTQPMGEGAIVLLKRDDEHQPFVTARVWWHNTPDGGTVREWDHGHYFDTLPEARKDFAERAGLR